jgi:hypothetical protein
MNPALVNSATPKMIMTVAPRHGATQFVFTRARYNATYSFDAGPDACFLSFR